MLNEWLLSAFRWVGTLFLRGVSHSWVTLLWVVAFLVVGATPSGVSRVVGLLLLISGLVATLVTRRFRPLAPVISDMTRTKRSRAEHKQVISGYQHATAMRLIPPLANAETEAWALKKPRKRLRSAQFIETEGVASLVVRQQIAATTEEIEKRAVSYAAVLGFPGAVEHVSVAISGSTVRIVWQATLAADPLELKREGGWRTVGGTPVLGRTQSGEDFTLDMIHDSWHLGGQGRSRSGKSVFMYLLLGGYAEASRQGDLILGGVDPTGILLSPWQAHQGAEYRALGLNDLDAITAAVTNAVSEMDRRISWLMESGRDKVESSDGIPTLAFILEEYPGLVSALDTSDKAQKPADRRLPIVKNGVQRLIQEGAKAGVRVAVIAQRMDASIIGGSERSNIGTRISLAVDNRDAVTMLHPDVEADTVEKIRAFKPGYAYVERPAETPQVIRFDAVDYQQYRSHVIGEQGPASQSLEALVAKQKETDDV